ncbi:MAG: ROK family protein, partial [Gemmataceae bacterium]
MNILAIDVGGTSVKLRASAQEEVRKFDSGTELTPAGLVEQVNGLACGWEYDVISLGLPCVVGPKGPAEEPMNLGRGWIGFDYEKAFGVPVRVINDAAMQALGGYTGGRMLFLGLGTGLGTALIAEHVV